MPVFRVKVWSFNPEWVCYNPTPTRALFLALAWMALWSAAGLPLTLARAISGGRIDGRKIAGGVEIPGGALEAIAAAVIWTSARKTASTSEEALRHLTSGEHGTKIGRGPWLGVSGEKGTKIGHGL